MSTVNLFQVSLEIWGCLICVIVGIVSGRKAYTHGGALKCLWTMLVVNGLMLASDSLAYVFRGDVRQFGNFMTRISNFMLFFTEGTITYLYIRLVEALIPSEKQSRTRWGSICRACVALQIGGLIATPFTGFYYSFSSANHYHREPGIYLSFVGLGLSFLITSFQMFQHRKSISGNLWRIIRLSVVIFLLCFLVQLLKYGFSFINVGITLVLLMLFSGIWMDEDTRAVQREIDAMEQSIAELMEMYNETH